MYPRVYIKSEKKNFLDRKHPWVYSGALKQIHPELDNQPVYLCDEKNNILATGYYQNNSIALKILDFSAQIIDENFWEKKIYTALQYRKNQGLPNAQNNAYRLIFAEGDNLPGLIIDNYNGHFVMMAYTKFMHQQKEIIHHSLQKIFKDEFIALYDKTDIDNHYTITKTDLNNTKIPADTYIQEHGLLFYVNWKEGQKTGFFLDQRDNRHTLMKYVKDKIVLNTFAYSGGFSVYAAYAGAKEVHSVDISDKAIEWCNLNMHLNGLSHKHQSFIEDSFVFLDKIPDNFYDVIILDPPAFAKNLNHKARAIKGYERLNTNALHKIKKGGYLITFSCSGVIDKYLFYNTIHAACFKADREVKIIDYLHLPADHPVKPNFPEGEYLKGMILYVE